eukprot:gnl/MRDRNA2_/MRDRNA2_107048_c0_seq1.p1 gnl/MRDRNA2_/MRDRNA2_107048_c0~~gnl/MRDRNA2_/MRDRNA2_107048_c0_seq1.p1  ORF type:complete len:284 (+),score=45.54 gnl/MRDRNA2_/MRDRNA2_107048_c0_seq1:93-944(+)
MLVQVATALIGLIVLGALHVCFQQQPRTGPLWGHQRAHRGVVPSYTHTILPNGACNISAEDGLPAAFPNPDFPTLLPMAINPNYGGHIVATGRDGKLYHKYQTSPGFGGNWTNWKCITPDLTKVPCSAAPKCNGYDNSPAIAWQPLNGTLVVFVRQMDDLDIHEMHLADPKNPESWIAMRGPVCLCNFPPCQNQTKCGTEANCDNKGVNCDDPEHNPASLRYWNTQPSFPTSELKLLADHENKLNLIFRGFDGNLYVSRQMKAGDAHGKYEPPVAYGTNGMYE